MESWAHAHVATQATAGRVNVVGQRRKQGAVARMTADPEPRPDTPFCDYANEQLFSNLIRLWALAKEQKEIIAEARRCMRLLSLDIDVALAELTRREETEDSGNRPRSADVPNGRVTCSWCGDAAEGEHGGSPTCERCLLRLQKR